MARQQLGQHFLADAGWREKIARAIGVSRDTFASAQPAAPRPAWLEIGAGHGEMTRQLAETGAPVFAVELDAKLQPPLEALTSQFPNLTVLRGDILALDLGEVFAGRRFRVYGNLPYYITSPILHRLFEHAENIEAIYIVVQLEVAARLAARPHRRDYGYLSVLTQFYARPQILLRIPRGAFRPPPEVTSALVSLRLPGAGATLGLEDEARFFDFLKLSFAQKRKTLVNNLRALAGPEVVREALAGVGLRGDARGEQLSVAQFAALYRQLVPEA